MGRGVEDVKKQATVRYAKQTSYNRRKSKKRNIQRRPLNMLKSKQKENDIPSVETEQENKVLQDNHSAFKNYTYEINQAPFQNRFHNILLLSQLQTTTNSHFTFPIQTKPIQIICNNNINYFFANSQPVKKNLDELFRQTLNYHNK